MAAVRRLLPAQTGSPPDAELHLAQPDLDDEALLEAYAVPAGRHLRMNFVSSADGAVTLAGRSGGLSTPADKRLFRLLRELCDVVLVGAGTARTEGYRPPALDPQRRARRRARGLAEVPPYALVSGSLDLDPASALFTGVEVATIVVTRADAPADRRARLAAVADLVAAGEGQVDLAAAVDQLAERGLTRVLCEGGPTLFGALLAGGLVEELCLTVSPMLAGPGPGRVIGGRPLAGAPYPLELLHLLEEDGALFYRYALTGRP
jgi:riboflavin biosynthesis pyrimidine reductase